MIQVAEFGGSWSNVLKSIAIEIGQLIIQMTLLKSLTAESNAGGVGGFFASIAQGFSGIGPGKAAGGDVNPSYAYPVGEHGVELFHPTVPGTIIPHSAISAAPVRSSDVTIHQNTTIITQDANSFRRSEAQLSSQMFRDAAAAHARLRR
jgi:hypothetical protein